MISKETLKIFADMIFKETGIVYKDSNFYQLETRLDHIMQQNQVNLDQLLQATVVDHQPNILNQIFDQATNNETSFFRDAKVFQSMFSQIMKPFFEHNPGRSLNIWSVASSTGQEPYSLAMDLENYRVINRDANYRIMATDYSQRVLKKAQEGIYTQVEVQRGLSSINLVRYFEKIDARENAADIRWKVKASLRAQIEFRHMNLLSPQWNLPRQLFDVILCRNVLIYQDQSNRKEILRKLSQHLSDEGCLLLGCAEAITNLPEIYVVQQVGEATVYRLVKNAKPKNNVA